MSSSSKTLEPLWEDFFRDTSPVSDTLGKHIKKNHRPSKFWHKQTGQDENSSRIRADNERSAIIDLVKYCGKKKDINGIRRICADKDWINQDTKIATTLIRSYAKCGALKEAQQVFDQLVKCDNVTWNALIAGYADQGFGEEALECFRYMQNDRINPDSVTYACVLKASGILRDLKIVKEIHICIRNQGLLKNNTILGNSLVSAYAKCGALKEAQEVFDKLSGLDVVSWNTLIAGYADQGLGEQALTLFREMVNDGVAPDNVTFACCLKACAIAGALDVIEDIHSQVRDKGLLKNDIVLGNSLLNAYAKCGAMDRAQEVFDKVAKRDVVLWSALIAGYTDHGFAEEALVCFREMENDGVIPNSVTYACCLKASGIVGDVTIVEEIHVKVRNRGLLKNDVVLGNTLVSAYAKCGALEEALAVFDQLTERNTVTWNAIIAGYADQGFGDQAFGYFNEMQCARVNTDSVTYTSSLKACHIIGALDVVEEIHDQIRQQGLLKDNIVLGNSLINAYAKCGALKRACVAFDEVKQHAVCNVESWTALLLGYSQLGHVDEMLEVFHRMLTVGISPNLVTFIVLLNGCCHGAMLDEGQMVFDMIGAYGLSPIPEHYTCMVDLFSRVGQFDKAKRYVLDDNIATLMAFLSSCGKWINVDLGRWAFEKLIKLDQNCGAAYVCMTNIYIAAGMEKEASEIETLRIKKKLWKQNHIIKKVFDHLAESDVV